MTKETERLKTLPWESLKTHIGNEIFQAIHILESLEYTNRVFGNCYHWRQQVTQIVLDQMEKRRTCKDEPKGCPGCGQKRNRMILNEDKTQYYCTLCNISCNRE